MITASQAAQLCQAIYDPVTPNTFDQIVKCAGITAGIQQRDGQTIIAFAGSENVKDWLRDFRALPYDHPQLGTVHMGFYAGMGDAFVLLRPFLTGRVVISGHSLGCAHASILAGLCAINNIPVDQLFLFAPPRPGYKHLADLVRGHVKTIVAFRNGPDPVPEVPLYIPLIAEFVPICNVTEIHQPPEDQFDPFAWHAIFLYVRGMNDGP